MAWVQLILVLLATFADTDAWFWSSTPADAGAVQAHDAGAVHEPPVHKHAAVTQHRGAAHEGAPHEGALHEGTPHKHPFGGGPLVNVTA